MRTLVIAGLLTLPALALAQDAQTSAPGAVRVLQASEAPLTAPPPPALPPEMAAPAEQPAAEEPPAGAPSPVPGYRLVGTGDAAETSASEGKGEAAAPDAAGAEREPAASTDFVKGELSGPGLGTMVVRKNRVQVAAGYNHIAKADYLLIHPELALRFGKLSLAVGVPLNIEMFNAAYPRDPGPGENHVIAFDNVGSIRKEDWDEPSKYARVLSYLTYGAKEDKVYLDVGQHHVSTLGHGAIMRRYAPNIDVNTTRVGAQFDTYNDMLGFEAMTNDIMRWSMMGALGFVKPLGFIDSTFTKSLSLGATFAMDREAPTALQLMPEAPCPVAGACPAVNVPAVDDLNRLQAERGVVSLAGVDVEFKLLKTDGADIKPYVDYSWLLTGGPNGESGGSGLTFGILGRFNAGKETKHAFRLVAELRMLGANYRPSYFDTFYEVDKFLIDGTGGIAKPGDGKVRLTKYQATYGLGTPLPERTGWYVEAGYGVRGSIGVTLAMDGQSSDDRKNFMLHFELPAFSFLQLYASLYKRGFGSGSELFELDSRTMAFAGARLKLLPILFVSARTYRTFELDAYKGANGPLGTMQFQNVVGYSGDVALGWEF